MSQKDWQSDGAQNADAQSGMRSTSEYTHKSISPQKRVPSPMRARLGAAQPLQSALKKRVEQDNRTGSVGALSDQKSVVGGRSDSPLKQAQFRLDAPDTPAALKGDKKTSEESYESKTVEELEILIEDCNSNLEKQ